MKHRSIYDMFTSRVEKYGDRVFMRHKVGGKWVDISWNEMKVQVDTAAKAVVRLGIEPGRAVGILSDSRVEWTYADLGVVSTGCITTAAYPTSPPKDAAYVLGHAEVPLVIAENAEQVGKVLEMLPGLPMIEHIVVFDMEGVQPHEKIMSWNDFMELGSTAGADIVAERDRREKEINHDTLLTYIYTSGTTGPPKGAMLTHGNCVFIAEYSEKVGFVDSTDESLSFLPLAHALERVIFYVSIMAGGIVNFAEELHKVVDNMPEVRPTVFVSVPRVYEKIYEKVMAKVDTYSPMKKKLFFWSLEVGKEYSELLHRQKMISPILKLKHSIADALVFQKIKVVTGGRIRWLGSGGAPLSAEVNTFFNAIGLPMIQAYGLTETTAPAILMPVEAPRIGRVGKRMEGVQCEVAEDGEIMFKGPNVFKGYFKNPEATEESFRDGWFLTGDTGSFDDEDYLMITGRKKDLIITAGGKNITPQKLEHTYSEIPLVSQVVIAGDGKKYLTALFTINQEELEPFVKEHNLKPDNGTPLEQHPKVIEEIEKAVIKKNKDLPNYEAIKKFTVIPHEFTIESGELTPTMKVKKNIVLQRYKDLVEEMY